MSAWPVTALVAAFVAAAAATWVTGVYLSRATDALDLRWKIGETFGGMFSSPSPARCPRPLSPSRPRSHQMDIAAGNLLGGIAMQTAVLIICDFFVTEKKPLSYLVGSLIPVLEASLVIAVTSVAMLGALLSPSVLVLRMSPASILIVVLWLGGMAALNTVRNSPKWKIVMPGSKPGRRHHHAPHVKYVHPYAKTSTGVIMAIFAAGSLVTLAAGAALTVSGTAIATRLGINGVLFGATVLAAASALPEISTGIAAVRIGDNQLAMGDVFDGNAFQLTLFAVADLLAGAAVLPQAGATNSWLAGLGILVTIVYAAAIVIRPEHNHLRVGIDSLIVAVLVAAGLAGLLLVAR